LYEKILQWEFVYFADLRLPGALETLNPNTDSQKLTVLSGLEVAKATKKASPGHLGVDAMICLICNGPD